MNHLEPVLSHLECLDGEQAAMVSRVEQLCNINSGSTNLEGLAHVADELAAAYADLNGELQRVDSLPRQQVLDSGRVVSEPLGQSLVIRKRPEADRRVLLCIHMDTVYGVDHSFQSCRWLEDGNLNGPGVADAKGGLVVMLEALRAVESSPWASSIGWDVLINPDEEIGSPGSLPLIRELAPANDFGLLFEPALAEDALVSWRKGSGNFSLVIRGRSAHAGRAFDQGRNAIKAAAEMAIVIDSWNERPDVTCNLGRVAGGGALNVVPDLAVLRFNARVKSTEDQEWVTEQLASLVAEFHQRDGFSVDCHGEFSSPPKPITPELESLQARIERSGQALGLHIHWQGTGGASDGNKFAAAGLANIDTMGPCGGHIHSSDEFLVPSSLVPRAKLAALTMLAFAQE